MLVSAVLTRQNYHQWARSMELSLITKNNIGFVDDTIPVPSKTDSMFQTWRRANNLVVSWIIASVSESIAKSILYNDVACNIWKQLKKRFSQGDLFCISDIEDSIIALKQGELTVNDYLTELKILWDEIDNYMPLPECKCEVKCTCVALTKVEEYRTQDRVIRFLKGLNEPYVAVKSQIMLMKPLHDLDKVFSMVVQQERQLIGDETETRLIAAVGRDNDYGYGRGNGRGAGNFNKPPGGRGPNNGKVCTYCGKIGQIVDTYYRKHGFPPNFPFRNHGNQGKVNSVATEIVDSESD